MSADRWHADADVEFLQYKGMESLLIKKEGVAVLNGVTFRDGTIEFDVDGTGQTGGGIGFRRRDGDTYEDFYLRPDPNCATAPVPFCIQYAPHTHGVLLWDLFPQYQAPAPVRESGWNHVRLVISGRRMHVFVNGDKTPSLKVGRLEGDVLEGGLLLQGPGYFANLTVTPDAVQGLAPEPEKDSAADDRQFLRQWQVAPSYAIQADAEPRFTDLPAPSAGWRPLAAEDGGLINITRQYGLPVHGPERGVAWLKTRITSDRSQTKKVAIGWAREVWVYVNGAPVFADKNVFDLKSVMKAPAGRCSLENGSFLLPLKAGDNEIAVAVANNFYGWGLIMRLEDAEGVSMGRH